MPKESFGPGFRFLDKQFILNFEELTRLCRLFVELGTQKLRITGGEPLLRRQLHRLVAQLSPLGSDLSLTTNGSLLAGQARSLKEAGLRRVTVSVDSLDPTTFEKITDGGNSLGAVLNGIDAAESCDFESIKINTVVRRGVNDHELVDIAKHFGARGHTVRFIEFMDVGQTNGWLRHDVVPAAEMLETLSRAFQLTPLEPSYRGEVARRYRVEGSEAELGFITSVSRPFCGDCTRARLSANGILYTCLFAAQGTDLSGPLRAGASDQELKALLEATWRTRADRYSEERAAEPARRRIEMSYIGG